MISKSRLERESSTVSSNRSFLSRTLRGRDSGSIDSSSEDGRGPLGLTTLFSPQDEVIADLIFVHGLGGGSRSTWSKSPDQSLFWPQEWLPQDTGFKDVRIHSFGYNSNWDKESTLNIHDFAKSLLGSIQDCPAMLLGLNVPLIFVGHSMGGLVIKKAYILARQFQEFQSLASRVRAIFFLATPHRGSDLASLFSKILQISGARPFVTDLHRNSLATQSINDEFPQHCQDLLLYSFYETLPTNYGVGKGLIVEKDMAVLGYPNERTAYLNANHRDVCKYATVADPNYMSVRNALGSVIKTIRNQGIILERDLTNEHRRLLNNYLDISDAPEDDFLRVDQRRIRGSCEWLINKDNFQSWRDSVTAHMFWISAKPATGKSVLSGYVIKHLKENNRDTAFYFFDHGDKLKSTFSFLLRSIAWQMALMHSEVFQIVLGIGESNTQINQMDYRAIWRKLFLDGILKVKFDRPQYWVIDALDESKGESELVSSLLLVMELSHIRIIVTSRNQFHSHRPPTRLRTNVILEGISENNTKSDVLMYLEANIDYLPLVDEKARQNIVDIILLKSGGCFLWVSLVLQELRQVHTSTEIQQVLEDVPSDMNELYARILESMC